MSSPRSTGLITLCLLLGCRLVLGVDPSQSANAALAPPGAMLPTTNPALAAPGTIGPSDTGGSAAMPATLALPASTGPGSGNAPAIDASNFRKFYTITAELRETYDTNVNTAPVNAQTAWETSITPSILVDFPRENTEFTARYTFGLTDYMESGGSNVNGGTRDTVVTPGVPPPAIPQSNTGSNNSLQTSNEFVAQLRHDFSERFSVNASEQLLESTEPNLFGTTGTLYRNGENISNAFSSGLSAQWTPLLGTQTTYANTVVRYSDATVSQGQDSMENTGSQSFSFSFLPKISLSFGGIFDTITYDDVSRGYTSYTGFVGAQWQALPSISVSARGGESYTMTQQTGTAGQTTDVASFAPYGDLSVSWQLGERSMLSGDYSHEVTPTDQTGANGQQSDRVTGSFSYLINSRLTAHLQGIYTYSEISNELINSSSLSAYNESAYALDTGMAYHFDKYFDVNFDITVTGVSSQIALRDYSRDQFSIGVRGTY